MKVFLGIKWEKPTPVGYQSIAVITAVTGMLAYWIVPRLGGYMHHVAGLTAIALVTTWLSAAGAGYDRAGIRGMVVTTVAGAIAWIAALAVVVSASS